MTAQAMSGKAVGTVKFVVGEVTATALDGTTRILQVGERVFFKEVIATSANAVVQVHLETGRLFDLTPDSSIVLDDAASGASGPAAPPVTAPQDVEALQSAMAADAGPDRVASATAAVQDVPAERSGEKSAGEHAPAVVEQANTSGTVLPGTTAQSTATAGSTPEPGILEEHQPLFLVREGLPLPPPGAPPAAPVHAQAEGIPNQESGSAAAGQQSPITGHEVLASSDKLELGELLQGATTPNDVTAYLSFSYDPTTRATTVNVQSGSLGAADQKIVLLGVDLTAGGTLTTDTIIQNLLTHGKLHTEA